MQSRSKGEREQHLKKCAEIEPCPKVRTARGCSSGQKALLGK
jgi:hypothetical protein